MFGDVPRINLLDPYEVSFGCYSCERVFYPKKPEQRVEYSTGNTLQQGYGTTCSCGEFVTNT